MKDNERKEKEIICSEITIINKHLVTFKEEVVQFRESQNTQDVTTNALQDMFRNETEKLRNNEQNRHANFQGDLECKIEKFQRQMDTLHNEQEITQDDFEQLIKVQ